MQSNYHTPSYMCYTVGEDKHPPKGFIVATQKADQIDNCSFNLMSYPETVDHLTVLFRTLNLKSTIIIQLDRLMYSRMLTKPHEDSGDENIFRHNSISIISKP